MKDRKTKTSLFECGACPDGKLSHTKEKMKKRFGTNHYITRCDKCQKQYSTLDLRHLKKLN